MNHPDVVGHYRAGAIPGFSVVETDGRLFLVQPPIPEELSPELEWTGAEQLRILSGSAAGALVDLDVADGLAVGGTVFGALPFSRTDTPPEPTPGEGLRAPAYEPDADRDSTFESTWATRTEGVTVAVPAPYQAHEFVRWLMTKDEYIFHGSGNTEIEEFRPVRASVELFDYGGHGNRGAVYGTHDGLWAMFFAVVDRDRIEGSIRNGVATYRSRATGESVDLYQFSVSEKNLPERPFRRGALYVLPRAGFERIPLAPGGPLTNEWGSTSQVRPIAVIMVEPEDFPFLDRVGGHDDGELIRMSEVAAAVYRSAVSARPLEDGFSIVLSEELDEPTLEEFLELGRKYFPDMSRERVAPLTIEIRGPDALIHSLGERLSDLLRD